MLFNSWQFLIFFPIVTLLYFILPKNTQRIILLIASCVFYMAFTPIYILILLYLIIVDYTAGILIARANPSKRKLYLIISLFMNIATLAIFKYANLLNLPSILEMLQLPFSLNNTVLLPLGLSFHTFQSMSYTIEIYKKNFSPEKNFLTYALYVMFYPQLVAGPIEKPQNMLPQLNLPHTFDHNNFTSGLKLMLWGFFKKMVIADRIGVLISPVFSNPSEYSAITLVLCIYLFSFQIFCDFSGYTDIALGAAQVMGIKLRNNFNYPYLAKSVSDFWRRWHISLSSWFKDYLYIPLGGNRNNKLITFRNLVIVFLLSGLWHGADWKFVYWGGLHGFYIILAIILAPIFIKLFKIAHISENNFLIRLIGILLTFNLISFAWVLFRSNTLSDAILIYQKIFTGIHGLFSLSNYHSFSLGLDQNALLTIICLIIFMELIHYFENYSDFRNLFNDKPIIIRWTLYYLLIFAIIFLGVYSESSFIYFQF